MNYTEKIRQIIPANPGWRLVVPARSVRGDGSCIWVFYPIVCWALMASADDTEAEVVVPMICGDAGGHVQIPYKTDLIEGTIYGPGEGIKYRVSSERPEDDDWEAVSMVSSDQFGGPYILWRSNSDR